MLTTHPQSTRNLSKSRAFAVRFMAEPRIDVVPNQRQVGNALTVASQEFLDQVGIVVVLGDQAKGRVRVGINRRLEAPVHPVEQFRQIRLDASEQLAVSLFALAV